MTSPSIHRNRFVYLSAMFAVIALGLLSRQVSGLFPAVLGKYPGDALWALMVFLGLGACFPHASSIRNGILALAFSYLIEFSQLYHAPWIDAIRHTTPGHLVLGSGFSVTDLIAYTIGVGAGVLTEYVTFLLRPFFSRSGT